MVVIMDVQQEVGLTRINGRKHIECDVLFLSTSTIDTLERLFSHTLPLHFVS